MIDNNDMTEQIPDCAYCDCCYGETESLLFGIDGKLCRTCVLSALHCGGRVYECIDCPQSKVTEE